MLPIIGGCPVPIILSLGLLSVNIGSALPPSLRRIALLFGFAQRKLIPEQQSLTANGALLVQQALLRYGFPEHGRVA